MIDTRITDVAFEDDLMERARPRPRPRRTCETCVHYGCCDGLPHCGGTRWQNAYGECANCGARVPLEMAHEDGDEIFCSDECAVKYRADNEEEAKDGE